MKNTLNKSVIIGLVGLLSACAGAPKQFGYTKEGASEYDKTSALSECNYQIKLNKVDEDEAGELLTMCMQGKGYRYVRVQ